MFNVFNNDPFLIVLAALICMSMLAVLAVAFILPGYNASFGPPLSKNPSPPKKPTSKEDSLAVFMLGDVDRNLKKIQEQNITKQTKGAYRVGTDFNPSNTTTVDTIKAKAAELIDFIGEISVPPAETPVEMRHSSEIARLKAMAQTEIESAAMWAVKAATKGPPNS